MKRFKILSMIVALGLFFCACEDTNDNLVASRDVAVVPVLTGLTPESPIFTDFTVDDVSFTVSLEDGDAVDAAEIRVAYDGNEEFLQDIASFPSDITITAADILTALGLTSSEIELGSEIAVYVMTTSDGVTSRSQAAFNIDIPCEFDSSITTGSYGIVCDGWGVDSNVSITADEDDPYIVYIAGLAEADACTGNGNTMKVIIDPVSYQLTGDTERTIVADDCSGWAAAYSVYTNYSYTLKSGSFSTCDGSYEIVFELEYLYEGESDYSSWGDYTFTFTR
ncbi:hypothetical protein [Labilibaculum sp.]|uniref:hypothetical protein n=1 Tax=Labilibaculum sp. TaxID=2060723 RepID=UPI00356B3A49